MVGEVGSNYNAGVSKRIAREKSPSNSLTIVDVKAFIATYPEHSGAIQRCQSSKFVGRPGVQGAVRALSVRVTLPSFDHVTRLG
jgi:hypothetical protein